MVAFKNIKQKGEWIYILNKKLKYYTKEIFKYFNITLIAFGFITAIILIKYKPIYEVSISGEEVGYVQNKEAFEESIKENIITNNITDSDTQYNGGICTITSYLAKGLEFDGAIISDASEESYNPNKAIDMKLL